MSDTDHIGRMRLATGAPGWAAHAAVGAIPAFLAVVIGAVCPAAPPQAKEPHVTLILKDKTQVQGALLRLDDREVVLRVGERERTVPADQVTPASLYVVKRQVMDLGKAATHMELGRFLLASALTDLARREFDEAIALDGSLREEVARIYQVGKAGPTSRPAASAPAKANPSQPPAPPAYQEQAKEIVKYKPATTQQADAARKRAADWADKCRTFAPAIHLVETDHFWIYNARRSDIDTSMKGRCEKMYQALCDVFCIPSDQNIWVGKCPIFIFGEPAHWERFCKEVYAKGNPKAAGFCAGDGSGFVFVALGPTQSGAWFLEMLVHESTHAFLGRYVSDRPVPVWANEGLAEYMAAELAQGPVAGKRWIGATKEAVRTRKDISPVFTTVSLSNFDYGIAHSLVRFMLSRNRRGFGQFITLMKEGRSEEAALKETFGWTQEQLQREWEQAAAAGVAGK